MQVLEVKYDTASLSFGKKLIADLAVIVVMMFVIALTVAFFQFIVEPALGRELTVGLFVFLILAPSAIFGALIGRHIIYKLLVSRWTAIDPQ